MAAGPAGGYALAKKGIDPLFGECEEAEDEDGTREGMTGGCCDGSGEGDPNGGMNGVLGVGRREGILDRPCWGDNSGEIRGDDRQSVPSTSLHGRT